MRYIDKLNDEEILYICSVIPIVDSVNYFTQHPKEFSKIKPGFRATTFKTHDKVSQLLFQYKNRPFISSFIEKHVSNWIKKIESEIAKLVSEGEYIESAWLKTLYKCYFANMISIYFKLTDRKLPEQSLLLISEAIIRINEANYNYNLSNEKNEENEKEINRLRIEMEKMQLSINEVNNELTKKRTYVNSLIERKNSLEKSLEIVRKDLADHIQLEKMLVQKDEQISTLKAKLSSDQNKSKGIASLSDKRKMKTIRKDLPDFASKKPKRPRDMEDFRDCLGYTLISIGMKSDDDSYQLLIDHLCNILFTGKPIIVSRSSGIPLIKCVSNALTGSKNTAIITYEPGVDIETIYSSILSSDRILCLDNFIGRFDEDLLLSICDQNRDKIIFLTVVYDKTLHYVPKEFISFCHYINVNRIPEFSLVEEILEDPTTVEESNEPVPRTSTNLIWSKLMHEIIEELEMTKLVPYGEILLISSEHDVCQKLAFSILPYFNDILEKSPFLNSSRLCKYADERGRCQFGELLRRWFS